MLAVISCGTISESRDGVEHKSCRSSLGDEVCLVAQSWEKSWTLAALLWSDRLEHLFVLPQASNFFEDVRAAR